MNISIPNSGWKVGTCGWLARGLASGEIKIKPGICKDKEANPGLWLHFGDKQQVLAMFNPFDFNGTEYGHAEDAIKFLTTDQGAGVLDCHHPFTNACWSFLMEIAGRWCDEQNALRENDDASPLQSIVVSVGKAEKVEASPQ